MCGSGGGRYLPGDTLGNLSAPGGEGAREQGSRGREEIRRDREVGEDRRRGKKGIKNKRRQHVRKSKRYKRQNSWEKEKGGGGKKKADELIARKVTSVLMHAISSQ